MQSTPRSGSTIFDFAMFMKTVFPVFFLCCLITVSAPGETAGEHLQVNYFQIADQHERDFDPYFLDVLTLALDKSGYDYDLEPVAAPMVSEARINRMLGRDQHTVHWLNSSIEREKELIPIKVPLFKGLIGWRLLLIRTGDQKKFDTVEKVEELANYIGGQGHDWPDTAILQRNRLNIQTSASWEGLFRMLNTGRIDYFPRSVIEINRELMIFGELDITVEKNIVLQYPAAYYFFVNKHNRQLGRALNIGLENAVNDGSFDLLFYKYFGDILTAFNLDKRRTFKLENQQNFPLDNEKYWYKPQSNTPGASPKYPL